jgi:hypothetical protein
LDPHAVEGHFIGYDEEAKGYRIYWLTKRTVTIERAVYIDKAAVASPGDVVLDPLFRRNVRKEYTLSQSHQGIDFDQFAGFGTQR